MEGCLAETVRGLKEASHITETLRKETERLEVTKSLLNLLYNICINKSISLSNKYKTEFGKHTRLVLKLLSEASIESKKKLLLRNPDFVRLLAEVCPRKLKD